jgi:outer membrane protein OmpA-like peptidoglycan-associated protein
MLHMKQSTPITTVAFGALLAALTAGGCATKNYVKQTVDPVSGKLDQVATQTNQQGQKLDQTAQNQEKDETELSATKERAMTADNKAGDAINRADQASQKADQANDKADRLGHDLGDLRNTVANLDDYKQVNQAVVNFKFNSDKLGDDAKQQLDQMVANQNQYKRFFIAVEGFTDSVGPADYNNALSRRRADAVVEYLVAKHNIPIYRIHMVGLGKENPVDEARTRAARAKNRRVEVTLFSADPGAMAMNGTGSGQSGASVASPNNSSTPQQ